MAGEKKKVVAFTAGRRGGNTEIYIKTALMEIERMGIEVEMIRLNECDIHSCSACPGAPCMMMGPNGCIYKDDVQWLAEKFLDSDGFILGAPVWCLSPCGVVSDFRDRLFGPKFDISLWETFGTPPWVNGRVKQRPGGLISVGGALTENWTSLGMATLYTTTFSAQTNIVDHLNVYQVADMGEALMRKDYLTRAKYLGQNVGHAVLNPQIDWEQRWLGDMDDGEACPSCHLSAVIAKPGKDYVECVVCGRKGYIHLDENKKMSFTWPADNNCRLTAMGKFAHTREIMRHTMEIYQPHVDEIQEELKFYREQESFVVKAPSRQKK